MENCPIVLREISPGVLRKYLFRCPASAFEVRSQNLEQAIIPAVIVIPAPVGD